MMHEYHPHPDATAQRLRHVFVYGTLRRGEINDINRLQPAPRWGGSSTVQGVLFDLGVYPGLRLAAGLLPADPLAAACVDVIGEVYEIEPALEAVLDEIEGLLPQPSGEYAKREVEVLLSGGTVRALVYEIAPDRVIGRPIIAAGDWVRRKPG